MKGSTVFSCIGVLLILLGLILAVSAGPPVALVGFLPAGLCFVHAYFTKKNE